MRLIKMTGGLGNQMFIYAMYLDMHHRFGDEVKIDITDMMHYHVHHGYELHRIFTLPPCEFQTNRILKKILEHTLFRIVLERHQKGSMEAYRTPLKWPFVYYKGFYQNERYFKDVEAQVRQAFTFDERLFNERSKLCLEHIRKDDKAVSIHIRRGDYTEPKHWLKLGQYASTTYFLNAIQRMSELVPGAHYYVFSDDLQWVRDNLPLENATYVDWNTGNDSWQDMMLMSNCHHNIISNSTFSWWGAWLNAHTEKIVMTPKRWNSSQMSSDLAPASWMAIENVPTHEFPVEGASE